MTEDKYDLKQNIEILIVEDSRTQAGQLQYLLVENGYSVSVAYNGRQAMEMARRQKPTLIISDIVMPEMDGFALCQQIKADPALKETPVILLTSLAGPQDVIQGLGSGADNFIRKPYDGKYLLQRVHYMLANRALRQSDKVQMGIELEVGGRRHFITAERQQILDLLISTYEEAVRLNQDLEHSNQSLNALYHMAEGINRCLTEQEVVDTALECALELPGVRAGWILLRLGEAGVRVAGTWGLSPAPAAVDANGDCLCRRKLLAGELDRAENVASCDWLQATGNGYHHATVPLWIKDDLLGVMNLVAVEERAFDEEALRILYGVGHQVGQALARARLHEQMETLVAERTAALRIEITERKRAEAQIQRQLERLAALRAVDTAITSGFDLQSTLNVVLEQATTQLGVAAAAILLLNSQTSTLDYKAGRGFRSPKIKNTRLPITQGLAGEAARERRLVHVDSPAEVSNYVRVSLFETQGFTVYYGMPLITDGKVKGVLELLHPTLFEPDAEWFDFLETLAGQAAIAIDHAALFAETRRLLQQTEEQARLTRRIVDTVPEGMVVLNSDNKLLLANPTAREYLPALAHLVVGDVLTELGGQPLAEFLPPSLSGAGWRELATREPERIFEVATEPLITGVEIEGWVLVLRDVTTERQRQRYQQIQDRLATVGQLAAGIAHDFNNVMSVIVLYAQMLRRIPDLSAKHHQQLATISDQAEHATRLIEQILDFSRRSVMERASMDLLPLVKELLRLLERTLPENISLSLQYNQNQYNIEADPTRLQQTLMNLALNARDAMPGGGKLQFNLNTFTVGEADSPPLPDMAAGDWVSLAVSDTGTGIEPEHLPHLFEPFFTTKAPGVGTGLGLAQVYGIVKQHQGSIDVMSRIGQGTTFTVYLPLIKSTAYKAERKAAVESAPAGTETILVVEDNPAIRSAVTMTLEELGYRVLSVGTGHEALNRLAQRDESIALVLSDLVMPEMGGLELYHTIWQQWPGVKMIMMTGHPRTESEDKFLGEGVITWIQKPFNATVLAEKVRIVLDASDQQHSRDELEDVD